MANEFIIREGFVISNNLLITGSLTISTSITGSASTASYGISSSLSRTSTSASVTTNIQSSSYSLSSLSSSYALGSYFVTSDVTTSFAFPQIDRPSILTGVTSSMGGIISPFPGPYGWQLIRSTNAAIPIGTIYTTPIAIQSTITAQKVGLLVAGNTTNNPGKFDVGIYSSLSNLLPGTIIASASISGAIITVSSSMYTASLSTPTVLVKDNIYWLAMVMSGSASQNFYLTYQWTAGTSWARAPQNKLYNPLLGIHIPNNDVTYRNVAYYTTTSINLPVTMPSTTSSYTILSYGARVGTSTTNIPIPPAILF